MHNTTHVYRLYYARLCWLLLIMSGAILLLTGACTALFLTRAEPVYYVTSTHGVLTRLHCLKVTPKGIPLK